MAAVEALLDRGASLHARADARQQALGRSGARGSLEGGDTVGGARSRHRGDGRRRRRLLPGCRVGHPRERGGVPAGVPGDGCLPASSPRARGCTRLLMIRTGEGVVFPASAGVYPSRGSAPPARVRLPRERGGVPIRTIVASTDRESSPRAGGCTAGTYETGDSVYVFPASAGVYRRGKAPAVRPVRLPRERGGVPVFR